MNSLFPETNQFLGSSFPQLFNHPKQGAIGNPQTYQGGSLTGFITGNFDQSQPQQTMSAGDSSSPGQKQFGPGQGGGSFGVGNIA